VPKTAAGAGAPGIPKLVPCLMIARGRVVLPGAEGPEVARDQSGAPLELLDVADHLNAEYGQLYVIDLDGVERNRPQLDYLQEISREVDIWVDAGIRNVDQAIDVIVAGASRAVLSSSLIRSTGDLQRAWGLSQEIAFEVDVTSDGVDSPNEAWAKRSADQVAADARGAGIPEVVVRFRDPPIDWAAVRTIALGGPAWVAGAFTPGDRTHLTESGATGGIFHINEILANWAPAPKAPE
jgi:hypothetical protein